MTIKEIRKRYNRRLTRLAELLNKGKLSIEKQHQVYGAINEIQTFIETLNHMEEKKKKESKGLGLKVERHDASLKNTIENITSAIKNFFRKLKNIGNIKTLFRSKKSCAVFKDEIVVHKNGKSIVIELPKTGKKKIKNIPKNKTNKQKTKVK